MSTNPQFASTLLVGSNVLSAAAETSYTAPTHTVTIVTAGANGSKVEQVDFAGTGTTLAGVVQLYLFDGSTYHAQASQLVTAVTPSSTQAPFFASQFFSNLFLPNGWSLVAASFAASQLINVIAYGGSF